MKINAAKMVSGVKSVGAGNIERQESTARPRKKTDMPDRVRTMAQCEKILLCSERCGLLEQTQTRTQGTVPKKESLWRKSRPNMDHITRTAKANKKWLIELKLDTVPY
jgi:hypothetical protein